MRLEVAGLSFAYPGGQPVLSEVGFSVGSGDIVAVLGPNGVGKSTLFRCLLGFLRGWQGAIEIDGRDIRQMGRRELARCVAYVPQSSAPVFDYTLREIVMMGMTSQIGRVSSPGREHERRADEALEAMGIGELSERGCGEVSGGQLQLAYLARALVQDARILVMDEPTANLDYGNQYRVAERIARLGEQGYAAVMSTHDPNQALQHANRALVLEGGRVVADGDPSACLDDALLSRLYGIRVGCGHGEVAGRDVLFCLPVGLGTEENASSPLFRHPSARDDEEGALFEGDGGR